MITKGEKRFDEVVESGSKKMEENMYVLWIAIKGKRRKEETGCFQMASRAAAKEDKQNVERWRWCVFYHPFLECMHPCHPPWCLHQILIVIIIIVSEWGEKETSIDVFFWGGFCSCIQDLSYKKLWSCWNKCFFCVWLPFQYGVNSPTFNSYLPSIPNHLPPYLHLFRLHYTFYFIYYFSKHISLHNLIITINNNNYDMLNTLYLNLVLTIFFKNI